MKFLRKNSCVRQVILIFLAITLITLFLTGKHIYTSEKLYNYGFNKAYLKTNVTVSDASYGSKESLILMKNKTQSRSANETFIPNSLKIKDNNSKESLKAVKLSSLHARSSTLSNKGYQSEAERKEWKPAMKFETRRPTKEDPKIVIILAYMHTGSSYTARIIQNHPGTFYDFEPLRSLQDSFRRNNFIQFLNGTSRRVSGKIIDAEVGAEAVGNMITCNHDKLDVATLSTEYKGVEKSDNRDTASYFKCMMKNPRFRYITSLRDEIKGHRNILQTNSSQRGNILSKWKYKHLQRAGVTKFTHTKYPFQRYTNLKSRTRQRRISQKVLDLYRKNYTNWQNWSESTVKKNIKTCLPHLLNKCKNAIIRLTKYIRMTMEIIEQLLAKYENLRVIHLLRDPRAMMDSQLRKNDMNVKAFPVFQRRTRYMCTRMERDLEIAERLKKSYPNQIFTLRYEDLVDDPLDTAQQLFHFTDIPFMYEDKKFILSTSIEPVKDSKYRSNVWRTHISQNHLHVVNRYCNKLYKQLGYISFTSISDVRNFNLPDHSKSVNISSLMS